MNLWLFPDIIMAYLKKNNKWLVKLCGETLASSAVTGADLWIKHGRVIHPHFHDYCSYWQQLPSLRGQVVSGGCVCLRVLRQTFISLTPVRTRLTYTHTKVSNERICNVANLCRGLPNAHHWLDDPSDLLSCDLWLTLVIIRLWPWSKKPDALKWRILSLFTHICVTFQKKKLYSTV